VAGFPNGVSADPRVGAPSAFLTTAQKLRRNSFRS
jgi:hypothetical protein